MEYYSSKRIKKENADIYMIVGERSNGKSYDIKHEEAIKPYILSVDKLGEILGDAFNDGDRFFLVRRFDSEIKPIAVYDWFKDVNISKITNGVYNTIDVYRGEIFFASNETGTKVRGEKIGYIASLSTEQNYAMRNFNDVKTIIFEEFLTRTVYLANEPDKLMNLYSTLDRKRNIVKIWMLGNTISRVCPYFSEWGILPLLKKMKAGDIATKYVSTGSLDKNGREIYKKIAIEYTGDSGTSSYVIGKHKDMMNKGSWQSDPQPKLPKSKKEYKILYRIGFLYKDFSFLGEYLYDKEEKETVWFIYPYQKTFKNNLIIFSDVIKSSKRYQRNIYDLSFKNDKLSKILSSFREGQIFYSSDLCGTDFKQAIDFSIRK